jgi:protease-4
MLREIINAFNAGYIMEAEAAKQMAEIAYLIRTGKIELTKEAFMLSAHEPTVIERRTESGSKGRLSLMTIEGTMFRNDMPCGPSGYLSMAERLEEFDHDSSIDAHLFKMHTNGGQIEGLETFANVIANTKKPVIGFGENIFSAGVYAAAGMSSIVLSGKNARMGSVGVQANYRSISKMLAEKGIEDFSIKATTSPDKNNYDLDKEEDRNRYAKDVLDPLDERFMDHVKTHRPGVAKSALTGKTYFAEEAIQLGLADHIGTFEFAVNLALDMSGKNEKSNKFYMSTKPEKKAEVGENPVLAAEVKGGSLEQASTERIEALEGMVSAKDKVITLHLQTIETQKGIIAALEAENDRLAQLPSIDPEAETTAPKEDVSNKTETVKPKGGALPPSIQAAIEDGKKRRERHLKQGKIKA